MWVFDEQTLRFLAVNEAAIKLYGYTRAEFLALTIKDIRPPETIPKLLDFLASAQRDETSGSAFRQNDWQHRKKDGTLIEVEASSAHINFQGRDARMVIAQNIGPRRELERNLQAQEQLSHRRMFELQTIYQQTPIGLCFLDRGLRYVKINERLAHINGRPVAEHIGRTVREVLPAMADRLEPMLRRILETGEPVANLEFRAPNSPAPSAEVIGQVSYHPVRDAQGEIIGINAAVVDITERKRAEQALGQSERQFRELADALPQIVWTTLADGRPEYFNRRWFDFTGLSVEESMKPHSWQPVLHPDDLADCARTWSAALQSGNPYEIEIRYRHHTGSYRWFLVRAVPVKDEQGRVVRWFGSSTDIDDRKRATEALKQARERLRRHAEDLEKKVAQRTATLQESLQSLEGVLYHVAHDLRAPLRAMQGLTTLLLEEYAPSFDAEGREYAGRIVGASSRMDALIRDLLAYGRLGHVHLPAQRVELEQIVKLAIDAVEEEITAKDAQIQIQHPLPPVQANDTMLQQIVINLLSNALKFVAPDVAPRVRIWAETKDERIRLFLQDNGIGIDLEHHQRIFRVFERLHRVEEYPGTGIGLAIVVKGMERMGGRVGLESEPGRGSRFWLELPAANPPEATP